MSTRQEQNTAAFPETEAGGRPTPVPRPPAPSAAGNAIHFGPRARRLIRAVARVVNPLVLRITGRRYLPILGVVRYRGRKTGRWYATPLGVRPTADGGFVIPLTFSQASQWYQNIRTAGCCVITSFIICLLDRQAAGARLNGCPGPVPVSHRDGMAIGKVTAGSGIMGVAHARRPGRAWV